MKNLTVVEKLVKLDKIFDELLYCTGDIWNEIKYGEVTEFNEVEKGEALRLITSITSKYDKLNKEFNE